jgi:hypothetical protein
LDECSRPAHRRNLVKSLKVTDKIGSTEKSGYLDRLLVGGRMQRPKPKRLAIAKDW